MPIVLLMTEATTKALSKHHRDWYFIQLVKPLFYFWFIIKTKTQKFLKFLKIVGILFYL